MEHYAKINSMRIKALADILRDKGYVVNAYWIDYETSVSSATITYSVEGQRDATKAELRNTYLMMAAPDDSAETREDRTEAFQQLLESVKAIPSAEHAMKRVVLQQVEKLRELAEAAGFEANFLNPIEVLAEQLRTNILEHKR